MAGYTRQDTANNIANGNVIDADDFDAEYNAVEAAFNASTGHSHDGTAGEGAPIEKVGPSQDLVVTATSLLPKATNTLDLGTNSVQFKNAWFDGTVDTDALTVSGNATIGGTLGVTGVLTATGGLTGDVTGSVTGDVTGTVSDISNHSTTDLSEGTNLYYTNTRARNALSVTDNGGDGSLSYNNGTGVITYTGPSASQVRAHISAGEGINFSSGVISGEDASTSNKGIAKFNSTDFSVSSGTVSLAKDPVVTLTGDVSGSGTMTNLGSVSITTTVANNSHTHTTGNITGLAEYIADTVGNMVTGNTESGLSVTYQDTDNTLDFTLTKDPTITLGGDLSGSATLTNLGNATLTATIKANSVALGTDTTGSYVGSLVAGTGVSLANNSGEGATPTISIGQAVGTSSNVTFGNATINGNLIVNGTTTTVNSNDVNIGDATLTLNSDETGTPSQDAGITIERGTAANKSFLWDESEDEWSVFGERIKAGTFEGALSGNATTATRLATSRTISLGGDLSGSASFNGTSNITITATVADDSHNHTLSNIDGITATTTEINKLDGFTGTVADLNYAKDLRATGVTVSELDKLDGFTGTVADLNYAKDLRATGVTATEFNRIDGLTASASELNKMDGCTATTTELNYVDGVTSNIQTQLNGKASTSTLGTSTWEAGTSTTEVIVSPAKIKAAIEELAPTPTLFGVGQTWQNVASSRVIGTSYQAPSDKAIQVHVDWRTDNDGPDTVSFQVSSNGSTWITLRSAVSTTEQGDTTVGSATLTCTIPAGTYYRISTTGGGVIDLWVEMR